MLLTTIAPSTILAQNANELALHLQGEWDYTVTLADQQGVLQPFAQIWHEQAAITLDDLLDVGLDYGAAAYLVGWLESH